MLGTYRLLETVVERIKAIKVIDFLVLTTNRSIDDELVAYCDIQKYPVFRGDPYDLVARTCQALSGTNQDYFLRINGDSPMVSPTLINYALKNLDVSTGIISNIINRTFPYGVSLELINTDLYRRFADKVADGDLEHVTRHLYRQINQINYKSILQERNDVDISLTIDSAEDKIKFLNLTSGLNILSLEYWDLYGLDCPQISLVGKG